MKIRASSLLLYQSIVFVFYTFAAHFLGFSHFFPFMICSDQQFWQHNYFATHTYVQTYMHMLSGVQLHMYVYARIYV